MKTIRNIAIAAALGLAVVSPAKALNGFGGQGNDTSGPEIYIVYTGGTGINIYTSATLPAADGTSYADQGPVPDGSDDTYIGVINKSTATLNSVALSGAGITGFDGDGIANSPYTSPLQAGDPSGGYEGPGTVFSAITASSLTVSFTGGLAPGGIADFSLEGPIASGLGSGSLGGGGATAPDSGSTMALLGLGTLGLGAVRRRIQA